MRQLSQRRGNNLYWHKVDKCGEYLGNNLVKDKEKANKRLIMG